MNDLRAVWHLARVLVLIDACSAGSKRERKGLAGVKKLTLLDFLVRYPTVTDVLLADRNSSWPFGAGPTDAEMASIESSALNYKFADWVDEYNVLLGNLLARTLITADRRKKVLQIRSTASGHDVCEQLRRDESWEAVARRCDLVVEKFDLSDGELTLLIKRAIAGGRVAWAEAI